MTKGGARLYAAVGAIIVGLAPAVGDLAGDIGIALLDSAEYPEVKVVVSAPPSADPADVTEAYEVLENGERRLLNSAQVPAAEVEIALVVDTAPVSGEALRALKGAATELVLRLPGESAVSLVTTSDPPKVAEVGNASLHGRVAAVGALTDNGERALYDAVVLALDQFSGRAGVPRSIVLIGGGVDVASSTAREAVTDLLARRGVTVHALHWGEDDADRAVVESLVGATGGLALAPSSEGAASELDEVLSRLSNLYKLSFEVREPVPTEVEIRLAYGDRTDRTTVALRPPREEDARTSAVPDSPSLPRAPRGGDEMLEGDTGQSLDHAGPSLHALPNQGGGLPWPTAATTVGAILAFVLAGGLALVYARGPSGGLLAATPEGATSWTWERARSWLTDRRGVATLRGPRQPQKASRLAWPAVAGEVHDEVDGDITRLGRAAEHIESRRKETTAKLRAAGLEGRVATVTLTATPAIIVVVRLLVDPAFASQFTTGLRSGLGLVAAGALTATGGLWMRRAAKPPFTWQPAQWRGHGERMADEQQVADVLDSATLYAVAGLDLESAIARACRDSQQLGSQLIAVLGSADPADSEAVGDELAQEERHRWLTAAPEQWPEAGTSTRALAATSSRLQDEWAREAKQRARRVPIVMVVPFLACILPAALLVVLAV